MALDSPAVVGYCVFVTTVLGLCMGSFLNCLAWRMTHGESILHGRSHCTSCGHELAARDLIPVVSWLLSRGKCRYCGERVSWRYPAVELMCAVVYVSILLTYGLTVQTIELIAFASVLIVLSLTDLDSYIIPNKTIIAAIVIRLVYIVAMGVFGRGDALVALRDSLLSGIAVAVPVYLLSLVMDRVLGRESLGGGDIKLLFVAGMYFGWMQSLFLIMVACVLGIVLGMLAQRHAKASAQTEGAETAQKGRRLIPFGPAIALACWICMLVGEQVVSGYLRLFML